MDPYLDTKGSLHVGGRLKMSSLTVEEIQTVILPKKCKMSNMTIQCSHQSVAHRARAMILNHVRKNDIWIVNANAILRYLIYRCAACRKLRGRMGHKKDAQRLPPFKNCGMYMFGTFIIKKGDQKSNFMLLLSPAVQSTLESPVQLILIPSSWPCRNSCQGEV